MKYLPLLAFGLLATPAFADEIIASAKPLPNATVTITSVSLSCEIQPDASLNHCRLADGATASKKDQDMAIGMINGKGHVAGAFVAGSYTRLKVVVRDSGRMTLLPIG